MSPKIVSSEIAYETLNPIEDMGRRNIIKLLGLGGTTAMTMGVPTQVEAKSISDKNVKVLVVGAGAGGIMALVQLYNAMPNSEFMIIAPNESHLYQPGQVFMAAGLYTQDDLIHDNRILIPEDVEWIRDEVTSFHPDYNKVTTRSGKEVAYDYMVVATGIVCHYEKIIGLTKEDIGTNGIASVYLSNLEKATSKGAEYTWTWFNELRTIAASGKKPTVIYTQPATPIKSDGTPQNILYLSADYLRKEGFAANYIFATNRAKLFDFKEITESLEDVQKGYDTISNKFEYNLVAMDVANKVATFEETYEIKGEFDKDLDEYDMIVKKRMVDMNYDFIHVVPPMGPPKAVIESLLGYQKGVAKGWLEVNQYTLQHKRYPNIFGIGDVCGIPKGKTMESARYQAPIVTANLVSKVNGESLNERYDGYTICPLHTEYGKLIMAEFNYEGLAPSFPLDPAEPRWIWWAFDLYMLKPMYWHLMMKGWM